MAADANITKTVGLLVELAQLDTVYRDMHLARARQLLSTAFDEMSYRAMASSEKEIDDLIRRSRSAVLQRDWAQAAELSARVETLRQANAVEGGLRALGKEVYDAEAVVFEPFSPGKHLPAQARADQGSVRAQMLETLGSLIKLDSSAGGLYEKRRGYFSGLQIASASAPAEKTRQRDRSQAEQLAMEAAEKGDLATLQRLATELKDWKEAATAATTTAPPVMLDRYQCPVDLSPPFPAKVVERAREFGLTEARTSPFGELTKVREVVYTHVDQPVPADANLEREGVLRSRALAELQIPPELDSEEARVLAGQFIQQIFLNSAGVRYLPPISPETILLEDFPENESADAPSKLLAALQLGKRSSRSRAEIESALMRSGLQIVADLGLDPAEFRLVCIPYDLYTRFGRERGFGKWSHWTHFDGYQVMGGNRLRALVGGDGRFGGLYDLVSISPTDAREGVYARFAVVRRARMTLRWR